MKCPIWLLLFGVLIANLSNSVNSLFAANAIDGVCKGDSNAASCTDETSLIQSGLQMKKKSQSLRHDQQGGETESISLLQLPPAAKTRCSPWIQSTSEFGSKQNGKQWHQAVTEAGLDPKSISLFGQVIPKFTAAEVGKLTSLKGKSK